MPTFFGYSVTRLHDRQMGRRENVCQRIHSKLAAEYQYAGVFNDRQNAIETGLYQRPAYAALYTALRLGDCVCFIALDRCFESLDDMITKANDLVAMGIRVILADARIDTGTKEGKTFLKSLYWSNGFGHRRDLLLSDIAHELIV